MTDDRPVRQWRGKCVSERTTAFASLLTYSLTHMLCLLLVACSPSPAPENFQSQFFSRVEIIGRRGTGSGELNKPRSVALDTNDNLYVVDMTGRVQKFSAG